MEKIIISGLFCLVTVYAFGQDFCMYLLEGQKVCYEVSATSILIRMETPVDITDMKNALQNTVAGSLKEIFELSFRSLFYVEMQNTSIENLLELRREWSAREDVTYTSPIILYDGNLEDAYANEIFVKLKSKDDYPALQERVEVYSIKDIRANKYDDRTYILTLPHNPGKDAAETSLELYETGLFEYAEPGMLGLWPFGKPQNNINIAPERTVVFYPNPASDILHVDAEKSVTFASRDIRLYNSLGNMCRQAKVTGGTVEFSVSDLPGGIYFLIIHDGSASKPEAHKIIVKH
ncbi:MAG: T9SS type A sorting domain-containing protein [Tannerella sp.]|nr:T9SS type A sorting domain-containing protein [Tannerella sp.]